MARSQTAPDFEGLSVAEKILHVQDLWDRIADRPDDVALTAEQREELDRRLADHASRPDEGAPWEVVRDRIRKPR